MAQSLDLKYGTRKISFALPDQTDIFRTKEPETKITTSDFESRLYHELESLNPDYTNVSIVLSDKTRLCGYPEFLPVLLKTLEAFGAEPDRITIFIAYGIHPRQTDKECRTAYGDAYQKIRLVHHDCLDDNGFENLGQTTRGTSILVRRDIVESSFLITFGAISHHYFAGYGGGRKLIFPGLGHRIAIYHNHGLFLDSQLQALSPYCQPGVLDGNPLAEDLAEFETFCPADFAIHGILDSHGNVCNLLPGAGSDHFHKACAEHGKNCEISTDQQYNVVIASCGGYPKDINFIQSHKAIENAAKFVRDGGSLIILAECNEGVGSKTFLPWFEIGSWKEAFKRLSEKYEGNGGTALSMMSKLRRINISLITDLNDSSSKTIGFNKISMNKAINLVQQTTGSIAAIPNASLLVKVPS